VKQKLILLLALIALMLGVPGVAHAGDDGRSGDNAAIAINKKNGSSLFKFAFSLRRVLGDVVDNENAAVAYASCESCRTTAIAIQIVFVVGSPSTVNPTNVALSVNENCSLCQTFASAFQFVIGVSDASVGFTKEGKQELKQILRAFKALKREEYTLEEFHAQTQALAQRLRTLLKTQLVSRAGKDEDEESEEELDAGEDEEVDEERPSPPPAPTTTGDTTTGATTGTTTGPTPDTTEPTTTETTPATTEPAATTTETETGTATDDDTSPGGTTTAP
jgi:putative peptide zinc metalloprotease protein